MMQYWFKVILLVMSSNLDDFGFGLALGFREKVCWWVAAIIGLMSGVTMAAGMLIGTSVTPILSIEIEQAVSAGIYITMAFWFAIEELQSDPAEKNSEYPKTINKSWTPFSALIMGIALGIDSFFLGISAGLLDMPFWFTSISAGISSFLLIFGGASLSQKISRKIPQSRSGLISAGLLLLLAFITLM